MISKGPEGRTSLIKFEFWGSTRGQSKLFHSGPDKPDPAGPYMINFLILSLILILIQILRKQAQIVGRYNECYVQCRRLLNYSKTTSAPPSEASVNIYLTLWIVRANNKIVTLSNAKKICGPCTCSQSQSISYWHTTHSPLETIQCLYLVQWSMQVKLKSWRQSNFLLTHYTRSNWNHAVSSSFR